MPFSSQPQHGVTNADGDLLVTNLPNMNIEEHCTYLLKMNMPFYRYSAAAAKEAAPRREEEKKGAAGEDFGAISLYCAEKASSWDADDMKENVHVEISNAGRNVRALATKVQALSASSQAMKIGAPPRERVFQDRKNGEGKRIAGGKPKKDSLGNMLQNKIAKSEDVIAGLQGELKRKDAALEDLEDFASNLQELLRCLAKGDEVAGQLEALSRLPVTSAKAKGARNALQLVLKEKEDEILSLKEQTDQLAETASNQGGVIQSLEGIIGQKDQTIEDMHYYQETDTAANKKILAHVEEQSSEALKETQRWHAEEINTLYGNVASQSSLIVNLKNLLSEKDEALEEMCNYNEMNDDANRKLLALAAGKHSEELCEHELRMKNMHSVLVQQLRGKILCQREMGQLRLQLDESDKSCQVDELKFLVVALAMVTVCVALASQNEWFLYGAPLYFAFIFVSLE